MEKFWQVLFAPITVITGDFQYTMTQFETELQNLDRIFQDPSREKIMYNFMVGQLKRFLKAFPPEMGEPFKAAMLKSLNNNDQRITWESMYEYLRNQYPQVLTYTPPNAVRVNNVTLGFQASVPFSDFEHDLNSSPSSTLTKPARSKPTNTNIVHCHKCSADHQAGMHISFCKTCKVKHPYTQHVTNFSSDKPYCSTCFQNHVPGSHVTTHTNRDKTGSTTTNNVAPQINALKINNVTAQPINTQINDVFIPDN